MSKEVIKKAQKAQIIIMTAIHKVCEDKGIKYYIIGGTALGAVRHGGFIPWDPDIDIAMPRPDYDRFIDECEQLLQPTCTIKCYKNDPTHSAPHALVVLNGSSLVNTYDKLNNTSRPIYVDVFPLDVAPNDLGLQYKQAKRIQRIKDFIYRKQSVIYEHNSPWEKAMKNCIRFLLAPIPYRVVCEMLDNEMKKYSYPYPQKEHYLCSMASHYSYKKQCMPQNVYGIPKLIKFEGYQFYAPNLIDNYLTRIYKNYMELPSEKEQNEWYSYLESIDYNFEL